MAEDDTRNPARRERAVAYAEQRQQSAALFSQAQRDAARAWTEFAQARTAAPPAVASASREATV